MANGNGTKYRHFILSGTAETQAYRSRGGGDRPEIPERNRAQHARKLQGQMNEVRTAAKSARQAQQEAGMEESLGIQVEFESFPDIELAFESLARERSGIELQNLRHEGQKTYATVFVPDGKLNHFESLIRAYLSEKKDSRGYPRDNRRLIDAIQQILSASLRALWTDDAEVFPTEEEGPLWWEVWLPIREDRSATLHGFRRRAEAQEMQVAQGELFFPERTVLLVRASLEQMQGSMTILNNIAELRRAKETAEFFDDMPIEKQRARLDDLLARIRYPSEEENVPYICLLDTGVNRGHPLLTPALVADDLHTVNPAWGVDDTHGHGTQMAGLALTGDLTELLAGSDPVEINHRLESVKLLPYPGATGKDPRYHGYLTKEAVARPEITAPLRRRVFSMTITARDNRDRGKPSAWSATLDSLAADVDGDGDRPRLLIVSAGNVKNAGAWDNYPDSNVTDEIHDPAQAWNALTVGAYTNLTRITETDAIGDTAVAPAGGLSPFSTTSQTWQKHWPLKPDVVFEGGNVANSPLGAIPMPSLSLLTTDHQPTSRLFTTAHATSSATALASRFAAEIMAIYPDLWPETIRALIAHSAEWTSAMQQTFLPPTGSPLKEDYKRLIQCCGFGVPNLALALWSVENSLTMVVEENLHPFKEGTGSEAAFRDMHFYHLPWPIDVLEELGETEIEMRVTLSYFIEPNPSQRGVYSKYRYPSHGLRFDVRRPTETTGAFLSRINAAARDEEEGTFHSGDDPWWLIGPRNRHKGSLHGDIWRGSAAELARRGVIGVCPAAGWWKKRPKLERYNQVARYALVVSIRAPEVDVDLYTPVTIQVAAEVQVEI
jgi:hypothetical protein